MPTLIETQAGGGQAGTQVAASGWKKVLRFGDGVWPPEPPTGASTRVGHDLRPNGANAEGQQVCAQATSWTSTWI